MSYEVNIQFYPVEGEFEAYRLAEDITHALACGLPAKQWIEMNIRSLANRLWPHPGSPPLQEMGIMLLDSMCSMWVKHIFQIRFLMWPQHKLLGAVSSAFPGSMPNHIKTGGTSIFFQDHTDQDYSYAEWGNSIPLFSTLRSEVLAMSHSAVCSQTGFNDPEYARRSLLYQKIVSALELNQWLEERPANFCSFAMSGAVHLGQCSKLELIARSTLLRLEKEALGSLNIQGKSVAGPA